MLKATLVIASLALAVGVPAALAGDKGCSNPAICQYVEQVPTSKGSKAVGTGGSHKVSKLPTSVEHSIREESTSQAEADTLEKIATTSGAGAPKKIKVEKAERKQLQKKLKQTEVERSRPVQAGFSAVSDSGNGRLLALVIVMSVMTLGALALAVIRRRSTGS